MAVIPTSNPVDEMLIRGLDDLCQVIEIQSVVRRHEPHVDKETLRADVVITITELLHHKLFRAGETRLIETDGRPFVDFVPWREPIDVQVRRIADEYERIGDELTFGDICWFELTPEGRSRGEAIVRDAGE